MNSKNIRIKAEAEYLLRKKNQESYLKTDLSALIEELSIHQIELEYQNEELQIIQERLSQSEARFKTLFNQSPVLYITISKDFIIKDCNQTFLNEFKVQKKQMFGHKLTKIIHPDDQDIFYLNLNQLKQESNECKFEVKLKIEIEKYNHYACHTLLVSSSNDTEFRIALFNIQSEKELEQTVKKQQYELKINEYKYRSIVEQANSIFFILNATNLIVQYISPNSEELLKLPPIDIQGKSHHIIRDLVVPEALDQYDQMIIMGKHYHSNQPKTIFEIKFKIDTETCICFEATATSSIPYDTDTSLIIISLHDITLRKRYEKEIIKAKEQAEESVKLKSIFLANMSHEIRTPLNGVLGFAQLLKTEDLSRSQQLSFIDTIEGSGHRLLEIINNLIDLSKIESGLMEVKNQKIDFAELMRFHYKFFAQECHQKGIKLKLEEFEKNHYIYSDKDKINSILTNLIKNAIKYTNSGQITFGYHCKNSEIIFYVQDTGIGIPENKKHIVFERFRQAEEHNYHKGSGLGLSIAKGFAHILDGDIWFESEQNKGSTFYWSIPDTKAEFETELKPKPTQKLNLTDKLIYIAEDDEISFLFLYEFLRQTGAKIKQAFNGQELIELIKIEKPDLILLDLDMPIMNGYVFLEKLGSEISQYNIIAQSAFTLGGEKQICLNLGCKNFISKPIEMNNLFEIISKTLY